MLLRILSPIIIVFAMVGRVIGQETQPKIDTAAQPPVTLLTELDAVVVDIRKNEPNSQFFRYFTSYAMPVNLQEVAGKALSFTVHSMSNQTAFRQPVKLSPTLWRIDIRDYGWETQAIENTANIHPYVAVDLLPKPYVDKYRYMLNASGNALFRLDWFVVHTLDLTRQRDIGLKQSPYYELLYGVNKVPKNIDEFRAFWNIKIDFKSPVDKFLKGAAIDTGESRVSNHSRLVVRKRTETGYYWETWDHPDFDYIEKLDMHRSLRKAGEGITSTYLGLQAYILFNGENGNIVDFADNTFVRDREHPTGRGDRVITPISCMNCHNAGINEVSNKIRKMLKKKVGLYGARSYDYGLALETFYLSDLDRLIKSDQDDFAAALLACNGLTPDENLKMMSDILRFYDAKITLPQAALECGVSIDEFREKLQNVTSGRLAALLENEPFSRDVWDRVSDDKNANGRYGLAMTFVHTLDTRRFIDADAAVATPVVEVTKPSEAPKQVELEPDPEIEPAKTEIERDDKPSPSRIPSKGWLTPNTVQNKPEINVMEGDRVVGKLKQGEFIKPDSSKTDNNFYGVYYNGKTAWVRKSEVEVHTVE